MAANWKLTKNRVEESHPLTNETQHVAKKELPVPTGSVLWADKIPLVGPSLDGRNPDADAPEQRLRRLTYCGFAYANRRFFMDDSDVLLVMGLHPLWSVQPRPWGIL